MIHVFFILCLNTLTIAFELFIKEAPLAYRSSVIFTLALCGVYLSLMALSYYAKPEYKSILGPMLGIGLLIMAVYLALDIFFAGNRVIVGEITTAYVFLNVFLNIYLYLKNIGRKPVFGHEIS